MDRQTITVDIAPGSGPIQRIRLSQGDIGRQLGVYIIQNGAAVDCSGYSAHLYVLKPDKNYYEKTCSISSNLISWETAEQETPLAGECKAQIRITANGMDIGTANFIEAIEATPAAGGTASESLISSMTQYVDAAETAARTAVEAEDTVEGIISTYSGIPGRVTNAENSLAAAEDGLAIVANGNTHAAIASGQFVYVKNHGSLAEGLYVANSAIATNAALTTSNLTADGSGGLNALKAKIGNVGNTDLQAQVTSLNSNFTGKIGVQAGGKSDLSNIPPNSFGFVRLTGSASPMSYDVNTPYFCVGASSYASGVVTLVIFRPGRIQMIRCESGTWGEWQSVSFT
jgi:hypothetical protein